MPQSYLIVGGSSDIALLLAESLLDDGHAVTLLARDSARCQTLENRGAELIQGDALDADLVQQAVQAAKTEVMEQLPASPIWSVPCSFARPMP